MASPGRIIIVSNRLPVSVTEHEGELAIGRSIGGLATALSSIFASYKPLWVGWTGMQKVVPVAALRQAGLPKHIVPIQAPWRLMQRFYEHFATRVLWPALHSVEPPIAPKVGDWQALETITATFAARIKALAGPEDIIWVHDFHLLRLPHHLRRLGLENRIGFFLHTPFPPAKQFLALPYARELLQGICQTTVAGFQTPRDADNIEEAFKAAGFRARPGLVWAFPIGVDFDLYANAHEQPIVRTHLRKITKATQGKRMILSISRLDYTKGILHQLRGVERFLRERPDKQRFVYRLVVAPSREGLPEYQGLKRDIAREVKRINKSLGTAEWQPIDYHYENIDFPAVSAHYLAADVLLLTPALDGMNLIAKEYIAARQDDDGMLVIGETIGAAFQLRAAVHVAALDTADIANGLERAFTMPAEEKQRRWRALRSSVREQNVFWWADQFMLALEEAENPLVATILDKAYATA